jgi:hypothetical protein
LDFNPPLNAITAAKSKGLSVKSRWSRLVDSGKNSASAMAAAEASPVDDKNSRLREEFKVKAVRKDVI